MRGLFPILLLLLSPAPARPADVADGIRLLMESRADMEDVAFGKVVHAVSGRTIIPVKPAEAADRAMLAGIATAMKNVFAKLRDPGHPCHEEKRINEVSRHFEDAIRTELDALPDFSCDLPPNRAGKIQRSGYPDLRPRHEASGRVSYLDPKLFAAKSRNSSLRTVYFTPKKETNKILDDARHLLIGIAHGGKQEGSYRFEQWELVDLAAFRTRLKVEFQAGNRDIYREENIVARGE